VLFELSHLSLSLSFRTANQFYRTSANTQEEEEEKEENYFFLNAFSTH
jgi:hypothetical protein